MSHKLVSTLLVATSALTTLASEPDWSSQASITPGETRANIYQWNVSRDSGSDSSEFEKKVYSGKIHALWYPVTVTGMLIPFRPMENFLKSDSKNPLKKFLLKLTKKRIGFSTMDGMYEWMGLAAYPENTTTNVLAPYFVPSPLASRQRPDFRMGTTILETPQGKGLTFSCAACHSSNLFGRPVLGMANKRSRANQFFVMGETYAPKVPAELMYVSTGATKGEVELFKRTQKNIHSVEAKMPQTHGLDTSLAITALSLTHRIDDEYATKSVYFERNPRENELRHFVADSKPLPWWNVKYKTRWLADGSVISGNPIYTNFLWNELGRGTDLHDLEKWLDANPAKIQELTTAVFASEAPKWVDFFGPTSIDLVKAKKGQALYQNACLKCHGDYVKGWSLQGSEQLDLNSQLATVKVIYHEKTPVKDVGTDMNRAEGMKYFADALNQLSIAKKSGTVVEPQQGYVPAPLVGIWARYPYLHNSSVPSLCALLNPQASRPAKFYLGPADNAATDFDQNCVGYPVGSSTPESWKTEENLLDTGKPGLSNKGHEKMLLNADGSERFSTEEKFALIEFLKTL